MPSARWRIAFVVAALAAALAVASCDDNNNPVTPANTIVPQSWAGVWSLASQTKDCLTDSVIETGTEIDTICAGNSINQEFDLSLLENYCPGATPNITDTRLTLSCSHQVNDPQTHCNYTVSVNVDVTLNAAHDHLSGILHGQTTASPGTCEGVQCFEYTVNGTRLSTDQTGCPAHKATGLFGRALVAVRLRAGRD